MSLLNHVLLPPTVKAYLSQGERFIKWDDVSGAGAAGSRGPGVVGLAIRGLARVSGLAYVCGDPGACVAWPGSCHSWLDKQTPGVRVCALSMCPRAACTKALGLDVTRGWLPGWSQEDVSLGVGQASSSPKRDRAHCSWSPCQREASVPQS